MADNSLFKSAVSEGSCEPDSQQTSLDNTQQPSNTEESKQRLPSKHPAAQQISSVEAKPRETAELKPIGTKHLERIPLDEHSPHSGEQLTPSSFLKVGDSKSPRDSLQVPSAEAKETFERVPTRKQTEPSAKPDTSLKNLIKGADIDRSPGGHRSPMQTFSRQPHQTLSTYAKPRQSEQQPTPNKSIPQQDESEKTEPVTKAPQPPKLQSQAESQKPSSESAKSVEESGKWWYIGLAVVAAVGVGLLWRRHNS
jgi:hypothetical protein